MRQLDNRRAATNAASEPTASRATQIMQQGNPTSPRWGRNQPLTALLATFTKYHSIYRLKIKACKSLTKLKSQKNIKYQIYDQKNVCLRKTSKIWVLVRKKQI
jgi:hypothetical protein